MRDALKNKSKGQALITLLFFIIIGMSITSAAAIILMANMVSTSNAEQGTVAYYSAESGVESALISLVRNPAYIGETLPVGDGTVIIQVVQGNPITITATGKYANAVRKIQAKAVYNNNILSVTSWKEIN